MVKEGLELGLPMRGMALYIAAWAHFLANQVNMGIEVRPYSHAFPFQTTTTIVGVLFDWCRLEIRCISPSEFSRRALSYHLDSPQAYNITLPRGVQSIRPGNHAQTTQIDTSKTPVRVEITRR
jgi:hypothetical protein